MSPGEIDPSEFLARTRRSWSPEVGTAERVRRGLDAKLAAGAAIPSSVPRVWPARLMLASAFTLAAGGGGYWAGYRAGERKVVASIVVPATVVASSPGPVVPPIDPSSPIRPAIEAPAAAHPAVPGPHRQPRVAHADAESEPTGRRQEEGSLAIELRAVRSAERALRDGRPGLALAFLHDLEQRVPHGELAEEREATVVLARCARDDQPFGVNLAADFTTRYPNSVYRARVEQACARTDASGSGDSSHRRSGP